VEVNGWLGQGLVLASVDVGDWGTVTNADGVFRVGIPSMDAGEERHILLQLVGETLGDWTNQLSVASAIADAHPVDNQAEFVTSVRLDADLSIAGAPGESVRFRDVEWYWEWSITNRGPHTAQSVQIVGHINDSVELVGLETSQGSILYTNAFDWAVVLEDLTTGGSAWTRAWFRGSQPGWATNTVAVTAHEIDPEQGNNAWEQSVLILDPGDLSIQLTGTPAIMLTGDPIDYEVIVANHSAYLTPPLRMEDLLPEAASLVEIVSTNGPSELLEQTLYCPVGPLSPGQTTSWSLRIVPNLSGPHTNRVVLRNEQEDSVDLAEATVVIEAFDTPFLFYEVEGTRLIVSWSASAEDYLLESTSALGQNAVWLENVSARSVEDGRIRVVIKLTDQVQFFRLHEPAPNP